MFGFAKWIFVGIVGTYNVNYDYYTGKEILFGGTSLKFSLKFT